MNIHFAKSANDHFPMISGESASLNYNIWDIHKKLKLFKNGFKSDQYQPSSFLFISSPPSQLFSIISR